MLISRSSPRPARLIAPKSGANKKRAGFQEAGQQRDLSLGNDDTIDAEFEEIFASAQDEVTGAIKSKYGDVILPKYLFTKRYVDYYT